jgi:GT2 family glycosyltransferase
MKPKVTIVIVNWNKKKELMKLLDSIYQIEYDNYQVIVVDNASDDDSVSAIHAFSLPLTLIENPQNLGGTGGFNSGLKFAMEHGQQDYIWLLDNDAIVTPLALKALVSVMEEDKSIALAGSKILNADQPRKVVETGANIVWAAGNVAPLNQNLDDSDALNVVFDVDYVAICSALVRYSALEKVGLMDQRYFLLWDDMDWGVSFKRQGFRVVAVGDSLVQHAAFTEKRSVLVDYYFGVRNPLLTISKHARGLDRLRGLSTLLRRAMYFRFLFAVTGRKSQSFMPKAAVMDFLNERWGKFQNVPQGINDMQENHCDQPDFRGNSILVLPLGSEVEINRMVQSLRKSYGDAIRLTLLIQTFRQHLFTDQPIDELVLFNPATQNVIAENFRVIAKVFKGKFDIAVTADLDKLTPFSFFVPKTYYYDRSHRKFLQLNEGLKQLWRVAYAFLAGELMAWILFPFVYRKSIVYQKQKDL